MHLSKFVKNVVLFFRPDSFKSKERSLQIGKISRTIEQDSRKSVKDPYKVEEDSEDI